MADAKELKNVCFPNHKSSPEEIETAVKILDRVIAEYEEELD